MEDNSIPRPILTKIPGELPKSKSDRNVEDLSKLTKVQLLEIKEREEKLLSNKFRMSKLPDKGKRIQNFYDKVLKEIELRNEVEKAAALFSDLNITSTGQKKLNNMEWIGKYDPNAGEPILDSDDEDETDPIKIIAGSMSEKKVKIIKPEKLLITQEDLEEIESFKTVNQENAADNNGRSVVNAELVDIDVSKKLPTIKSKLEVKLNGNFPSPSSHNSSTNSLDLEPHALYLFEKSVDSVPQHEKFKPYKTTKSNVHDPEKEKFRKLFGKNWEVTAATPPPIQHIGTQMLPLQDSVEIQIQYLERLKELKKKQTEERLIARAARKSELENKIVPDDINAVKLGQMFGSYRNTTGDSSDSEQEEKILSDDEVRDDEDERGGHGVTYPVQN